MKATNQKRTFLHTVKVTGKGDFPKDMLRYDMLTYEGVDQFGLHVLHKVSCDWFWVPTQARWVSFLWTVVKHDITDITETMEA